jgi:hypothetical protein
LKCGAGEGWKRPVGPISWTCFGSVMAEEVLSLAAEGATQIMKKQTNQDHCSKQN